MIFSNKVYNALKQVAQVWLPAAGTLYFTVAQIWHLPAPEEVSGTILAVDTFLGIVLGLSTKQYNNSPMKFDGRLLIETVNDEGGSTLRMTDVDPNALATKNEIVFKINRQ